MYTIQPVRAAASLTDAYVAGTIIGRAGQPSEMSFQNNYITLLCKLTIGALTTATIKIEEANELLFDLAYDGQSANFTAGLVVTGGTSQAKGVIVSDTDGGATGTLVIRVTDLGRNGAGFIDNEALTDSSTGVAVVNGALNPITAAPSNYSFYQETSSFISSGTDTLSAAIHNLPAATGNYSYSFTSKAQYVRISAKGNTTDATSSLKIDALVGVV